MREEEADVEQAFAAAATRDGRLAWAGHAVEPQDALVLPPPCAAAAAATSRSCHNFVEDACAHAGEAQRQALPAMMVELALAA